MKSVNQILKKHGVKPLRAEVTTKILSPNNLSRKVFQKFCAINGYKPVGKFNAFQIDEKIYGFSLCASYVPECRQFGQDYCGLVCQFPDGSLETYRKDQLNIGQLTRIDSSGSGYFNVKGLAKKACLAGVQ